MSSLFLLHFSAHHPHPHSFPTRRSSDLMVNPEGPAHRAGLAHGEEIQAVDETPVAGKTYEQVVKMIRGEPGTTVKLTLKGERGAREVSVTRVAADRLPMGPKGSHGSGAR